MISEEPEQNGETAEWMMDETFRSFTDEELKSHEFQIEQKLLTIEQKIGRLKAQQKQLLQWQDTIQNVRTERRTNQETEQNWEDETFAWSVKARQALRKVFNINDFRPQQLKTINSLMCGNDVLLLAPTGGGKSLCFQLPAILSKGVTVVISPLLSLMEDQVWTMEKLNIDAKMLCSTTEKDESIHIQRSLSDKKGPTMKLLYVTPERMAKSKRFMTALQKCYSNGYLARFAIDEVHCCSQWGHDFRPDYKYLGVLKEMFPDAPILGVTATATTKVITDVQKMLNMPDALVFMATFNRPNLYYHVLAKPTEKVEQFDLLARLLLDRFRLQSGIIYTYSMKDAVDICAELRQHGLKVAPYHGSLDTADRTNIHQLWHANELQAVVATTAFGMGINKADVRYVIHHTISKSMENYYQESGRAGRDGKRAECILLYHFSDIFRISTMSFAEHSGLQNAYAMVQYCINASECRRQIISRYFSDVWGVDACRSMCDRCANKEHALHPLIDVVPLAEQLLRIIAKAMEQDMKLTALRLVDAWMHKGLTTLRLSEPAPPLERSVAEQIVAFLITSRHLKESFTYTPYATLSYIYPGLPITDSSLMVRVGKLFQLPKETDTTQLPGPSNGIGGAKKRSLQPASATAKTAKQAKGAATPKSTKRAKNATALSDAEKSISSSTAIDDNSDAAKKPNDDEDVVILPTAAEIIEIDGD